MKPTFGFAAVLWLAAVLYCPAHWAMITLATSAVVSVIFTILHLQRRKARRTGIALYDWLKRTCASAASELEALELALKCDQELIKLYKQLVREPILSFESWCYTEGLLFDTINNVRRLKIRVAEAREHQRIVLMWDSRMSEELRFCHWSSVPKELADLYIASI